MEVVSLVAIYTVWAVLSV